MRLGPSAVRPGYTVIFAVGCVIHLWQGCADPAGYAAFAETAWAPLAALWRTFVMPNIGWLTVVMALVELGLAIGLARGGRATRTAAAVASGFFVFLLFLGYGLPQPTVWEHVLVNQAFTLAMLATMMPLLFVELPPLGVCPVTAVRREPGSARRSHRAPRGR